jgi:hypothetical protein
MAISAVPAQIARPNRHNIPCNVVVVERHWHGPACSWTSKQYHMARVTFGTMAITASRRHGVHTRHQRLASRCARCVHAHADAHVTNTQSLYKKGGGACPPRAAPGVQLRHPMRGIFSLTRTHGLRQILHKGTARHDPKYSVSRTRQPRAHIGVPHHAVTRARSTIVYIQLVQTHAVCECCCRGLHGNIDGVVSSCPTRWDCRGHTKSASRVCQWTTILGRVATGIYQARITTTSAMYKEHAKPARERTERVRENSGGSRGLYLRSYLELPHLQTFIFAKRRRHDGTQSPGSSVCAPRVLSLSRSKV